MMNHDRNKQAAPGTQNVHVYWADELTDLTRAHIVRPGDRRSLTDKIVSDLGQVGGFSVGDRVQGHTDEGREVAQAFSGSLHGFIATQGRNPDTVHFEGLVFLDDPIPSPHGKYFAIRVSLDNLQLENSPA